MESKFQIPSGSLPRRGRSRQAHSAAAGGSVEDRYIEFTSLYIKQKNKEKKLNQAQSYKTLSIIYIQKYICPSMATDSSNLKGRMHNELINTTQAKYCTNIVCSTEITLQKPHKNTVQNSDHENWTSFSPRHTGLEWMNLLMAWTSHFPFNGKQLTWKQRERVHRIYEGFSLCYHLE